MSPRSKKKTTMSRSRQRHLPLAVELRSLSCQKTSLIFLICWHYLPAVKTYKSKMSKSKIIDQDGFEIVKSKRIPKYKQTKIPLKAAQLEKEDFEIDVVKSIRRIQTAAEELRGSKYFEIIDKAVSTALRDRHIVEIICFGLGHIAECNISKYQLALLLCLKDLCSTTKAYVHDPIFYKGECEVLKQLGFQVILENNEGSYIISDNVTTLAYFPHCPKQLTNNFLWCNWGVNLHNCLLMCNSFNSLIDNNPSRIISDSVPYIYKILPHTKELPLQNDFKYTDIFNDTSLHHFPKETLEILESAFWEKGDKPSYDNTEEFITSLMIEKLNL